MVAPLTGLGLGRTAELAAPQDQRAIEQAAALQVLEQAGDGPVGLGGHAQVVLLDVVVGVPLHVAGPAARDDADEAHTRSPPASAPAGSAGRNRGSARRRRRKVERFPRFAREVETSGASVCILNARS